MSDLSPDAIRQALEAKASPPRSCPAFKPAGYGLPAQFLPLSEPQDQETLCALAAQIQQDPLLVQKLGERVLDLLRRDLELQQERQGGYGRRWL